jgi:two-component system response regulator HydG
MTPEVERLLERYDWPGNARQLRNVIDHLVLMETEELIQPTHLPREIIELKGPAMPVAARGPIKTLAEVERAYIDRVLREVRGNKTEAAKILGISRQTLRARLAVPA